MDFTEREVLSRAELKKVMGGSGSDEWCNSLPSGCPYGWHAEKCVMDDACPEGTLICVPEEGCAYYG